MPSERQLPGYSTPTCLRVLAAPSSPVELYYLKTCSTLTCGKFLQIPALQPKARWLYLLMQKHDSLSVEQIFKIGSLYRFL